jgi:hypothetical protein
MMAACRASRKFPNDQQTLALALALLLHTRLLANLASFSIAFQVGPAKSDYLGEVCVGGTVL